MYRRYPITVCLCFALASACGKSKSNARSDTAGGGAEAGVGASGEDGKTVGGMTVAGGAGGQLQNGQAGALADCDDGSLVDGCRLPSGSVCVTDEECETSSCVDGRCCSEVCEACEACLGPGGACLPVSLREQDHVPEAACSGDNWCDGIGRCEPKAQLVAGAYQTCALLANGSVRCWGSDSLTNSEIIGDNETAASVAPLAIDGRVVQLAAGRLFTCALLSAGNVRCWGYDNGFGKLGYGPIEEMSAANAGDLDLGGTALQITAGRHHACALLAAGNVRCWGSDAGSTLTPAEAGDVKIGAPAVQISAGEHHTCAILTDRSVRCWRAVPDNPWLPEGAYDVELGQNDALEVVAGFNQTCVLLTDGNLRCWDTGMSGQAGYGRSDSPMISQEVGNVPVGGLVKRIAAGDRHTCALLENGKVRCWGSGAEGQLGYGNTENIGDDETPASVGDVDVGAEVLELSAGEAHTCALLAGDSIRCWGNNQYGVLGYGNPEIIGDDETPASAGDVPYR